MTATREAREDAEATTARWIGTMLRRYDPAGVAPRFGSAAWLALSADDPLRVAGVIRAAGAWVQHCSRAQVEADLREQLAAEDRAVVERIRQCSYDVSAAADWDAVARQPTFDELARRRAYRAEKPERTGRTAAGHPGESPW